MNSSPPQMFGRRASKVYVAAKSSCVISWPGRIACIIYVIGFITMLTLTIRDFGPLLHDYLNNNNATQLNIQLKPIAPNLTICLPTFGANLWVTFAKVCDMSEEYLNGSKSMDEVCPLCEGLKNNSFDYWNYYPDKGHLGCGHQYYLIEPLKWIFKKILKDGPDNYLNQTNSAWFEPIIKGLIQYFSILYQIDRESLIGEEGSKLDIHGGKFDNYFPNEELDELYNFTQNLVQESLTGGCVLFSDSHDIPNSTTRSTLRLASFTVIHGNKFCFSVPIDFGNQDYACTYTRYPYLWNRYQESHFEIYPSPSILFSTINDHQIANPLYLTEKPLYTTNPSIFAGVNCTEHVYLSYDVISRLIVNQPDCSTEPNTDICVAKHQVQAAIDNCGCVSFSHRAFRLANQSGYPYCDPKRYGSCQKHLINSLIKAQAECSKKCEYTFDKWAPAIPKIEYGKYNNEYPVFLVAYKASNQPYTEFSVVQKNTFEQFLASVGGIINLYIGGSGLTLFALLILCIEQFKSWRSGCKGSSVEQQQQHTDTTGWLFLRLVSIFHMLGKNESDQSKKENTTSEQIENLIKQIDDLREEIASMKQQQAMQSKNENIIMSDSECSIVDVRF